MKIIDMKTKEELQKELNKIVAKEKKEMIATNYPKFKKLIGKCFKYRNKYSSGKSWWMYSKITDIRPNDVYDTGTNGVTANYIGWRFQTDCYGNHSIENKQRGYVHNLGTEIKESEFNTAFNLMCSSILALNKTT